MTVCSLSPCEVLKLIKLPLSFQLRNGVRVQGSLEGDLSVSTKRTPLRKVGPHCSSGKIRYG